MKSNPIKFYEAIGYLAYAIAAADGKVKPAEIKILKEILTKDWLVKGHSEEEILKIQTTFEQLINQKTESEAAMTFFKRYKENHSYLFTPDVKALLWKTVNSIAEAVAGKNKSELISLCKLDTILS